jgi:uncharacterized membrane protein YoaK (UPF0700 family)
MFRQHGPGRPDRLNRLLAGYLALVGGYVNSVGFVLIGTFTSHATGNVGRFANDLATRQLDAAGAALTMLLAFFGGAFAASMMLESNFLGRTPKAYGAALTVEASLLVLFTVVSTLTPEAHPRLKDIEAAMLCMAMGMQNSLVTRLSGAVVRTTHLTGVLTDLGIEGARWFRWWRSTLSERLRLKLSFGRNPAERPAPPKVALLGTIAGAFFTGAVLGSLAGVSQRHVAMIPPSLALVAGAAYAFLSRESTASIPPPGPASRR